jgi:hypothetical protein
MNCDGNRVVPAAGAAGFLAFGPHVRATLGEEFQLRVGLQPLSCVCANAETLVGIAPECPRD